MPIFYFEIETKQTGWIRVEAPDAQTVMDDVHKNGFEVSDLIESDIRTEVVSVEGGVEGD